ncbi:hypothetical protein GGI20_001211 [Coemansia sp. BCRC 34301]|nr:hypothetical protein GGI20_001211 [Coemansia sp. BCRC 34301]
MDNSINASQPNSLFNPYAPAENQGRRQNASALQSPGPTHSAGQDSSRRNTGFSVSSSANTSTQSVAGSTPQLPQKDIGFSLLQALLKPQPPPSQTYSASHTPESAPDVPPQRESVPANVMEQLKRMVAAQPPKSSDAIPAADTSGGSAAPASDKMRAPRRRSHGKPPHAVIDVRKVKLRAKPESVLISLLQQPLRFKPGRLISVSRDFICYAVRSKEGGRIRVIHQFHGQSAKMLGHTDSILDMAFHPCSKEQDMPQILASLGKDNRLVVWLVGSGAAEPTSTEDAIAYEPFINVDSGEDAQFTCLAWRSQIVEGFMELCVGTDMGFMIVKAPTPAPHGKSSDLPNDRLKIMPVATDGAVTAIERAGLHWVIVGTDDHLVRIYELDHHWETCGQPYKVVCELPQCEYPVDTLIYIAPAVAADGAGHLVVGRQMNRQIQLWWLGTNAEQVKLIQTVSFVGIPNKSLHLFTKLAWADQGRCLTVAANFLPGAMLVMRSSGEGRDMALSFPVGYSLGEEQPTLSLVATVETQASEEAAMTGLSIYGVHTRLVQQLQIDDYKPVEHDAALPDPAALYGAASTDAVTSGHVRTISNVAPVEESPVLAEDMPIMQPADLQRQLPRQAPEIVTTAATTTSGVVAANVLPALPALGAGLNEAVAAAVAEQLRLLMPAVAAGLQPEHTLGPEAEARLVNRISTEVERRVTQSVAVAMEKTLIPAYGRATAAMFEQMQATFESGLHEWWMRVAQMMPPPPPPPIATPVSHMMMPPQPQNLAPVMSQQGPSHTHATNMSCPTTTAGPNHIN